MKKLFVIFVVVFTLNANAQSAKPNIEGIYVATKTSETLHIIQRADSFYYYMNSDTANCNVLIQPKRKGYGWHDPIHKQAFYFDDAFNHLDIQGLRLRTLRFNKLISNTPTTEELVIKDSIPQKNQNTQLKPVQQTAVSQSSSDSNYRSAGILYGFSPAFPLNISFFELDKFIISFGMGDNELVGDELWYVDIGKIWRLSDDITKPEQTAFYAKAGIVLFNLNEKIAVDKDKYYRTILWEAGLLQTIGGFVIHGGVLSTHFQSYTYTIGIGCIF